MLQDALATNAKPVISCYKCNQNAVAKLANETRMTAIGTVEPLQFFVWHLSVMQTHIITDLKIKDRRIMLPTVGCISGCWRRLLRRVTRFPYRHAIALPDMRGETR